MPEGVYSKPFWQSKPEAGTGSWLLGQQNKRCTALKTTSKPTNEWDTSVPSEAFLILTQCSQLPENVFMEHWADWMEAQGDFLSLSLWIAVLNQKLPWQWEEFLNSRSIKTEGCWRSWAGIRVESSSFLYIFPLLLLFHPHSKPKQGLEGRSGTRLHVRKHVESPKDAPGTFPGNWLQPVSHL